MSRPNFNDYTIAIVPLEGKDGGGFLAYLPSFGWPTCSATGNTQEEAMELLREVFEDVVEIWEGDFPLPVKWGA